MGVRGKRREEPKPEPVEEKPPPSGSNSEGIELTDEERRALTLHHKRFYEEALAAKKAAASAFLSICKKAKAECGPDAVKTIKDMIELEDPEGEEKFRLENARRAQAARWVNSTIGTQFSIFDVVDRTPAADFAYEEGLTAGMAGKTCSPPYDSSTEQYHRWMAGWRAGQDVLGRAFAKRQTAAEIAAGEDEDSQEAVDELADA